MLHIDQKKFCWRCPRMQCIPLVAKAVPNNTVPREEKIKGKNLDMVAHLVHKNAEGNLAVVAVLIKKGQANAF